MIPGDGRRLDLSPIRAVKLQTDGSSWRVVVDVGEWDDSLFINSPGQSGDPASPHYSDLFRLWARDKAVPLLYSRRKVEAAAERRIVLKPTGQ